MDFLHAAVEMVVPNGAGIFCVEVERIGGDVDLPTGRVAMGMFLGIGGGFPD
jgi:hypothetical protein